jgi:hypothetical protein
MKIKGLGNNTPRPRLPSGFILQPHRGGEMHAQAWPRKRGKPKSATTRQQNSGFALAVQHSVTAPAMEMLSARELSQNTPYAWRDILVKDAYGTVIECVLTDGTFIMGLRMATSYADRMLNQLGQAAGMLLYRGADAWYALAPGASNQVLTFDGATGLPIWTDLPTPPAAGSGWLTCPTEDSIGVSTGQIGNIVSPIENMNLVKVSARLTPSSGITYKPAVAEWDGSSITGTITFGDAFTFSGSGLQTVTASFPATVPLTAGTLYAIGVAATGGGTSPGVSAAKGAAALSGWPQAAKQQYFQGTHSNWYDGMSTSVYNGSLCIWPLLEAA